MTALLIVKEGRYFGGPEENFNSDLKGVCMFLNCLLGILHIYLVESPRFGSVTRERQSSFPVQII